MKIARIVIASSIVSLSLGSAKATDYGVMGQSFPIIENDLLAVMEAKLRSMEASGKFEQLQEEMKQKAIARVRRPTPVAGISPALAARSWRFDPTITVEEDITDNKGNLIAARGQRVNPLNTMPFRKRMIFINGDRREEIDWAVAKGNDELVKVIFVAGSPFDEMKGYQRRFYFDQGGYLTEKFGIQHTPAIVEASGNMLKIEEIPIKAGGKS